MKYKVTNISNQTISFYAEDGIQSKQVTMMSGLNEIGLMNKLFHTLKPNESVISVDCPADEMNFKIEKIDDKQDKPIARIKNKEVDKHGFA